MNVVRLITIIILYAIWSFIEWDFNIANWGTWGRVTFIILAVILSIVWWIIGQATSDKKEDDKQ